MDEEAEQEQDEQQEQEQQEQQQEEEQQQQQEEEKKLELRRKSLSLTWVLSKAGGSFSTNLALFRHMLLPTATSHSIMISEESQYLCAAHGKV